jgi:MFS family permease
MQVVMPNRWLILSILTLARATMGFQFQSLAAVGPALTSESAISYTALGTLMGVYLLPGGFLAIPSGWLGKRFGDKRLVVIGLAMMTLGGAILAMSQVYQIMLAGRLMAGIGAVLLNVLVTKMVTDWFADSRIVTAMGVLIASWPLGISIALMIMAPLTETLGLALAFAIPAAVCALALVLVATVYTAPGSIKAKEKISNEAPIGGLSPLELKGALLSGCVWCFYNVALILPLSFGAEFLITKGISLASAGAIVSLTSLLIIPALPMGAWIADHLKKPTTIMVVSFVAIAGIIWMIPFASSFTLMFAILGLIFGPAGGLIMALPSQVLRNENRAVGMGIFFSVYYIGMGIFPAFAGYIRDVSADPAAPFWVAGLMIILAILALLGYRILLSTNPRTEQ